MDLIRALRVLLADQIALSLKTQGFHWNVEGHMFPQFHDFFQEIYDDIAGSIDPTAENIRKVGGYTPFNLTEFSSITSIEEIDLPLTCTDMVADLADNNEKIIESIDTAFQAAVDANEQGIANFLSERDDMHKKWAWQLSATLKDMM